MSTNISIELVSKSLNIRSELIKDDTTIETCSFWDSIGHLMLIQNIEELIGRKLDTLEMLEISSVNDVKKIMKENGFG